MVHRQDRRTDSLSAAPTQARNIEKSAKILRSDPTDALIHIPLVGWCTEPLACRSYQRKLDILEAKENHWKRSRARQIPCADPTLLKRSYFFYVDSIETEICKLKDDSWIQRKKNAQRRSPRPIPIDWYHFLLLSHWTLPLRKSMMLFISLDFGDQKNQAELTIMLKTV